MLFSCIGDHFDHFRGDHALLTIGDHFGHFRGDHALSTIGKDLELRFLQ